LRRQTGGSSDTSFRQSGAAPQRLHFENSRLGLLPRIDPRSLSRNKGYVKQLSVALLSTLCQFRQEL